MNSLNRIIADETWQMPRRFALTLAVLFLVVYVAAVVAGSALQSALRLPLSMGWFQHIAATATAILFAFALREPRAQLGLRRPTSGWLITAILAGAAIAIGGLLASRALPPDHTHYTIEWFVYQATLPGLGEEFGLRGPWLALVLVGAAQSRWLRRVPGWIVLGFAAVPFAALHILDASGLKLVVLFGFTFFAGVVLQWARLRNNSIWTAVLAHNLANLVSGLVDLLMLASK